MDEIFIIGSIALLLLVVLGVLPIVALVRTARIRGLERRVEGLEAALLRVMREGQAERPQAEPATATEAPSEPAAEPPSQPDVLPEPPAAAPPERPVWQDETLPRPKAEPERKLEEIIGERWLGWVGVAVLLFGAAFALKYAFDNRWIGELGRVMIGVAAGLFFVWLGRQRHRAGWTYFSQVLTAGGVTLLYLSAYASYGFYDLIAPAAAFGFLVLIVAQAHLLALAYGAPGIAIWGQIGGFLTPILLSTGHDRYEVLFPYVVLLDACIVGVCLMRGWRWASTVSFVLTHAMFWAWYDGNYHPEKLWPAVAFQASVFVLFAVVDFAPLKRGRPLSIENWIRLFANPLIFFASSYALLDPEHPHWMGVFAMLLAVLYAAIGRTVLGWSRAGRAPTLAAVGVSLLFLTLAIPIQLEANWITLAWGIQGAVLGWLSLRLDSERLRYGSLILFLMALGHNLLWDFPWNLRLDFTPVLNAEFLTALGLAALLVGAAFLLQGPARTFALGYGFAAVVLTWLTLSFETYRYTQMLIRDLPPGDYDARRSLEWAGNMSISLLWSVYATALVASGLRWSSALLRWAGLALFGLTVLKAFFVDIPVLEGFYRFVALIALGLLLIAAAWGYQKLARSQSRQQETV